jgi:SAM-dependent methyltransferase
MPLLNLTEWIKPRVISEKRKIFIFEVLRLFTVLLYPWHRFGFRKLKEGNLVIGSGPYYAKGWINLELNPVFKKDVWYDLRNLSPFPAGSMRAIYSSHVFEHLFLNELQGILKECYRLLQPGGVLRICLPCLQKNIDAYLSKNESFFQWEPEELNPFKDFSLAAKFSRNVLVDGAHKNMFDFESFRQVLAHVGFSNIYEVEYRKSPVLADEELKAVEPDSLSYRSWNSFFLEAVK